MKTKIRGVRNHFWSSNKLRKVTCNEFRFICIYFTSGKLKIDFLIKYYCYSFFTKPFFLLWQLKTPRVIKMAKLLQQTNSVYYISFQNLFQDVVKGKQSFHFIACTLVMKSFICVDHSNFCNNVFLSEFKFLKVIV